MTFGTVPNGLANVGVICLAGVAFVAVQGLLTQPIFGEVDVVCVFVAGTST